LGSSAFSQSQESGEPVSNPGPEATFSQERPSAGRPLFSSSDAHIDRALEAAKQPQLQMKLQNMPVPMSADTVDTAMRPVLEAARDGEPARLVNLG
jgi:alcohol dehydrogenase